jgi:hypothetical protein
LPSGPARGIAATSHFRQDPRFLDQAPVDKTELAKLERFLRRTFANHGIAVKARPKKNDSAEVYIGDEYVGIIHVDDEDGDRSFNFTMAILDVDLED